MDPFNRFRLVSATLKGRRAIVTGASSGIGEATALAFADAGATVALGARRKDRLEDLADDVTVSRSDRASSDGFRALGRAGAAGPTTLFLGEVTDGRIAG